jgi:hypothetical protein
MTRDDSTMLLAAALVFGGLLGALVWAGARKAPSSSSPAAPVPGNPAAPIIPIGPFPDLKVGDGLIVDAARASMPAPFVGLVPAVVDQVLTDRAFVSVRAVTSTIPVATFAGSIPRDAISRVVPSALPAGFLPVV